MHLTCLGQIMERGLTDIGLALDFILLVLNAHWICVGHALYTCQKKTTWGLLGLFKSVKISYVGPIGIFFGSFGVRQALDRFDWH